jgi:hypothetical protein
MHIDGGCFCGQITYEAEIDPERIAVCHCRDCQILSGGAFRWGVLVRGEDFRLLSGQPKIFVKTAANGNRRALAFCGECGSPLYGAAADNPQTLSLRLGGARQAPQLSPKLQIWCGSALNWLPELNLPGFEAQPPTPFPEAAVSKDP